MFRFNKIFCFTTAVRTSSVRCLSAKTERYFDSTNFNFEYRDSQDSFTENGDQSLSTRIRLADCCLLQCGSQSWSSWPPLDYTLTHSVAPEPEGSSTYSQEPATGPILSQLLPIYTQQANLPKIHSDPILPSTPWSSKWSLST
jgi:hypothetical protein